MSSVSNQKIPNLVASRKRRASKPHIAIALAVAFSSGAFAQEREIPVGTFKAEAVPVEKSLDFVGRVEATNRVEVRARVQGFLENMLFKEGDFVSAGAKLYEIEKGQYAADVEQAEGALMRSKAAKVLTTIQLQRAEELLQRQAGTQVARDQAKAADDQAAGQIKSDEGSLALARINLGYTDIRSPINGKVSKTNVTKGNVVGPNSGVLTMIVSQDPMYVTFPVSQRDFLRVQKSGQSVDTKAIKAKIYFSDGSAYDQVGSLDFVDVTVDRTTDTVLVRATMPNPKTALVDGEFVRVVLEAGQSQDKIAIPQSALIADQGGVYVFIVDNGKAAVRRVKTGGELGTKVIVDEGLKAGDLVIVDGLQGVRPGVAVRATPATQSLQGK
ncbi:MAG: efflux RND transporter periplasmic adaptor subunit [Beijerinckiaceae bacterium]